MKNESVTKKRLKANLLLNTHTHSTRCLNLWIYHSFFTIFVYLTLIPFLQGATETIDSVCINQTGQTRIGRQAPHKHSDMSLTLTSRQFNLIFGTLAHSMWVNQVDGSCIVVVVDKTKVHSSRGGDVQKTEMPEKTHISQSQLKSPRSTLDYISDKKGTPRRCTVLGLFEPLDRYVGNFPANPDA